MIPLLFYLQHPFNHSLRSLKLTRRKRLEWSSCQETRLLFLPEQGCYDG